ncbi:MAG: phosphoribosylaminoimidazolesuccinocarboxamide synthase [Deltaproteobacteria bacterium]|nr:phosphoribosylaminoimidazolesuccinocarboxamide synthase [Deltaproteobacteria bacterium]
MIERRIIEEQLNYTLDSIDAPHLGDKISGKVRDSYVVGDKRILVTTDRLSAFDRVLTSIPFKGQLLNEMAVYWFRETQDIVSNHLLDWPHPNVLVGQEVEIVPIEVVVRAYLTGSAWRDYQVGRDISGIKLPPNMKRSQAFEKPLITPSTKAARGEHDVPISSDEVVSSGLVEARLWDEICEKALAIFKRGTSVAAQRGLILVDTKYEFGTLVRNGKRTLVLADEIHTQDSSRYWVLDSYADCLEKGIDPHMLDKEFVRRMLMQKGYMGEGIPPVIEDSFRVDAAIRYIEAYEKISGKEFAAEPGSQKEAIQQVLKTFSRVCLKSLV